MRRTISRQELYDLLWRLPALSVAARLCMSRISLVRLCRHADIPFPDRKCQGAIRAGRAMPRPPLPPRKLGQHAEVEVGRGARLDGASPPAPRFEGDGHALRAEIAAAVRDVPVRRNLVDCHPEIRKLLKADEVRAARGQHALFASRIEGRRLRVLNALFLWAAAEGFGCRAIRPTARRACITVRDQAVPFTLTQWGQAESALDDEDIAPIPEDARLSMRLTWWLPPPEVRLEWVDDPEPIEMQLLGIAREIVFAAEWGYRWRVLRHHELQVARVPGETLHNTNYAAVAPGSLNR